MKYLIIILSFVVVNEMSSQFKVGSNTKQIGNNNFFELESLIGSKVVITKDSGIMGIGTATPLVDLDIVSKKVATNTINADFGLLRLARPTSSGGKWGHVAQFNLGSYTTGGAAHTRLDIGLNNDGNLTPSPILTLQGNGNSGFGITAPSQRLDVNGSGLFRRGNSANGFSSNQILFGHNGSNLFQHAIKTRHTGGTAQGNAIDFYIWTNAVNQDIVASQHIMSLEGQGRVGIGGITNPVSIIDAASIQVATATVNADRKMLRFSTPTDVNVKVGNVAEFNMGSYAVEGTSAKTRLDLALNDGTDANVSPVMTWQGNGNVGIRNSSPSSPLVVQGVTGNGVLKLIAPSVAAGDNWWMGFGHGTTSTDANDRARIGVDILGGGSGRLFFTTGAAGSQTRAMFIDENQRVGIGTSSPLSRLHVTEPINNAAFQSVLTVDANPATFAANGFNGVNPDITKMSSGIQFKGWNGKNEGGIFRQTGSADKSHMLFTVNTTNDVAMVINEARRVGIGTIAPATTLHVQHANAVTNTINADAQILRLSRPSLTNVRWDNIAQFNLGSYATVAGGASTEARTRLDLALNDGNGLTTTNIMTWNASGNVGIGTTAPTSKLEVNGAATNTVALNAAAATSIDFSASNIAVTSATATAIALNNLKDGGAYTLIFSSTAASGTVTFSATGFTFVYVGTEARTSGKKHIYSLIVAGTEVYVTMGTQN